MGGRCIAPKWRHRCNLPKEESGWTGAVGEVTSGSGSATTGVRVSSPGGEEGSRDGGGTDGEDSTVEVVGVCSASDGEAVLKKGKVREGVVSEEVMIVRVMERSPPRIGSRVVVANVVYTRPGGTPGASVWSASRVPSCSGVLVEAKVSKVLVGVSTSEGLVNLGLDTGR